MKGFDLGSSAVNPRAPGSSHRLVLNVPVEGLILTSGDGVLLQRQREMMSLGKLHNTTLMVVVMLGSLLQISLFLIECDAYLSFSLWLVEVEVELSLNNTRRHS